MANVLHHSIDFHPRPVPHAPPNLGFGFGLRPTSSSFPSSSMSMNPSPGWGGAPATPGHTNPAAFQQLASAVAQAAARPGKRRHDSDDDVRHPQHAPTTHSTSATPGSAAATAGDDSMDRSPTPERPKRGPPKRARVINPQDPSASAKPGSSSKNGKDGADDEDEVDVGVLLASLPPQSLLPLLTALIESQPSLKTTILPLIPRPTLETALQALAQAAKSLRDAYPYSQAQATPTYTPVSAFDTSVRPATHSIFDNQPTMRDDYVISRLRPFIHEYVSALMTYLPYFSCITQDQAQQPTSSSSSSSISTTPSPASNRTTTLHSLHKEKFHPSETFAFLAAVSNHIAAQPTLTLSVLGPLVIPRLALEWRMWVERIDEHVNRLGGMFGSEMVRGWESGLDELAGAKAREIADVGKEVRNVWIQRVGWLSGGGRSFQMMDEH